eukprot:4205755-Pyramimonas_sp.AAC.1
MLASPSTVGAKGKPKLGVAVLVRSHIGLRWPVCGGVIVPSRAMKVVVDIPEWPRLSVVGVYLKSGTGVCDLNVSYLKAIGRALEHDKLFV